ncbi:Trypanosomal VSG domain containing protein, putative [Trypanosoma equiperdum]|uniref:Trypanosomal VSG domain containing protein, putative n=1 Tax=Trypanosoma equiperdum TaxID=5694 RepID=A0A1G4I298_TRYEQ|nr:Trypanosomal VSG domain containing protein, putative [Trypanosoma equiperdum]
MAAEAKKLMGAEQLSNPGKSLNTFKAKAALAIYGANGEDGDAATAGSNDDRKTLCGTAGKAKGSTSGANLRDDMLCLCANTGSGGGVDKVCCTTCQATPNNWNTGAQGKAIFATLKKECETLIPRKTTSAEALSGAVNRFLTHIAKPQGSGGDALFGLGQIEGTAASGCLGVSNANGGICVIYAEGTGAGQKKAAIGWLEPVSAALAALERTPE